MKIQSKLIFLAILIFTASSLTDQCQLCMKTYKINCDICYNKCNVNKDFTNCTYYTCTKEDADGKCINWSSNSINSTQCLGTCCAGFEKNKAFNQPDFNLCVQRDAAQSYNVNIGLSIGLILSLFALLFLSGLACLLIMIFYDEKDNAKSGTTGNTQQKNETNINTTERKNISLDNQWLKNSTVLNQPCQICMSPKSTIVANCKHTFHYGCLSHNVNLIGQQRCPICNQQSSLDNPQVFCANCLKSSFPLQNNKQRIHPQLSHVYNKITCPNCHI